jgi:hypothetical protein
MTLANNPQLQERHGAVAEMPLKATTPAATKSLFADVKSDAPGAVEPPRPNVVPFAPVLPAASVPRSTSPPLTAKPKEGSEDEYDPTEFNRQAQSERNRPSK